ncbi:hypothetical protein ABMB44_12550 [Levilactobacillus brevis]
MALLFAGLLGSRFFSLGNFQSIASQLPILGLLALGMGITMLTGGINLSIKAKDSAEQQEAIRGLAVGHQRMLRPVRPTSARC